MIASVTISGEDYEVDEITRKYIIKKIGRLDRYVPRRVRDAMRAEAKLRQIDESHGNKYEVEVLVHLPTKTLVASDSTLNILAAVDIVEAKLVAQLHKYAQLTEKRTKKRGVLSRFSLRR